MMNRLNGYKNYRDQSILTSGPGELVYLLYNACIKQVRLAKMALDEVKYADANQYLIKAQEMVDELMIGLDFEYDIAHQLYSLYDYINRTLASANIHKDGENLDSIIVILEELRLTWEEVVRINNSTNAPQGKIAGVI